MISPPVRDEVSLSHLEILRLVLEFIDHSYRDVTPLSGTTQTVGVSRSHLLRISKRVTVLSLKKFLTRCRLHAAKELLHEPGTPIDPVALRVGFRHTPRIDLREV
jgi:AraC-like DNA-binding protein